MRPLADPTAPAPLDFLERATESVIRSYVAHPPLTPDENLLRRELSAVAEAVRMATRGLAPARAERTQLNRLRLLRRLRAAVLENWCDDGPLLATMRAFEATERALGESDPAAATDVLSPFSTNLLREVSHILRSPLGSIVALSERLGAERSGSLSENQRRQLHIIYRAAISAAATAGDLLTLTSPEERSRSAHRFSVTDTVETVADLVRPVTEARGSELVVRTNALQNRLGPASAVGEAVLGLALRAALMTRDGRVEMEASAGEGDILSFSVTSFEAGVKPSSAVANPVRIFREDRGLDGYRISQEGIAFSAAQQIIQSIGSELHVDDSPAGRLALSFRIALPIVD